MPQATVKIVNAMGLHARPSAALSALAGKFKAEFWITGKGRRVNGKSIMGVMMLAAACGTELQFETSGDDAEQSLAALTALVESGFGEVST
jgi:phosphocarrier protein HPr